MDAAPIVARNARTMRYAGRSASSAGLVSHSRTGWVSGNLIRRGRAEVVGCLRASLRSCRRRGILSVCRAEKGRCRRSCVWPIDYCGNLDLDGAIFGPVSTVVWPRLPFWSSFSGTSRMLGMSGIWESVVDWWTRTERLNAGLPGSIGHWGARHCRHGECQSH